MNYKIIINFSLVFFICTSLSAQGESQSKTIIKTIYAGKEKSLEVLNKYGSVHLTTWSNDSVCIKAEVKAFGPNQARLNKMINGVTINITESSYFIRAQTTFTQNIDMLFESFKGITGKFINYDSRVEIDYYINVPDYLNLKIDNKYGDVFMENCSGQSSVSVSNGSFKANSLSKGTSVNLTFSDATINSLTSGNLDASFSEITIGETKDLRINSISSRYDIKKAGVIFTVSRKDKFFIDKIESLQGNSYFTDYKVNNLITELNLTTKYGSVNAGYIKSGFESVNINSVYSDISLEFDQGSSYNLDIRHINAFLVLPEKNIRIEKKAINEEKKEFMTSGTFGRNPGTSRVKLDATHGNVYLK
jgi:hypothetical protein